MAQVASSNQVLHVDRFLHGEFFMERLMSGQDFRQPARSEVALALLPIQ